MVVHLVVLQEIPVVALVLPLEVRQQEAHHWGLQDQLRAGGWHQGSYLLVEEEPMYNRRGRSLGHREASSVRKCLRKLCSKYYSYLLACDFVKGGQVAMYACWPTNDLKVGPERGSAAMLRSDWKVKTAGFRDVVSA